jgi:hypothetical protein
VNARNIEVEITEDGCCIAVWEDDGPMHMLGDLEVTRLSDVEFDSHEQAWKVHFRNGITLPGSYKQRIAALNAEMTYVNQHLTEFGDWVKDQFPERTNKVDDYDASMS